MKLNKWLFTLIFFFITVVFTNNIQTALASKKKSNNKNVGKKSTELVIWHTLSSYNKNILKSITEEYSSLHSSITVKTAFYSNDKDIVINLIKKDSLPDIVLISTQYLNTLVNKNILVDLSKLIPRREYKDIDSKYWKPVQINNRTYGFPFMYDVFMLFINQNILWNAGLRDYKEPTNWNDINKMAERIHYLDNRKWGLFIPLENIEEFTSFIKSYTGIDIIDGDALKVNSAKTIEAMHFLQSLVYDKKLMPPKTTLDEVHTIFLSGKLAMMMSLSSELVYITSNFPYNLDVWKIPSYNRKGPYIKGNCLAIINKNNGKNIDKAFDLIEFLSNKENSIKWFTHTGSPPLKKSIKESLELLVFYENNPNYSIPMLELGQGRLFPKIKHYDEINVIIKNSMEEIMINGENPEKSLNRAQEKIDSLK